MPALAERPRVVQKEKTVQKEKDPRSDRAYLFISGGLGADHGLVGIDKAIRKVTGSDHVKTMNSIISMDPENPQRHQEQAAFIKEQIDAGREVEIITHSIGSLESIRAIGLMQQLRGVNAAVRQIEDQVPGYFDDPDRAGKLRLNFTASSGFDRGFFHEAKFLAKYVALGGPVNRAINAATAFPAKNMSSEEFADAARLAFGKKKHNDMPLMEFGETDNNYQHLPDAKKERLGEIDEQLKEAAAEGKKWKTRRLFKKRGKLVAEELQNVFDGKYVEGNDVEMAPPVDFVFLAKQPQIQKAIREMVSKSIYTGTQDLLARGAHLKVAHFELDRAITRRSVNHFLENTATERNRGKVREVEMLGHSGLVLQAENYIDAVTRDEPDRQVLFMPGIFANTAGLSAAGGIGPFFERKYGDENAFWVGSAVSADAKDPQRYDKIADYLMETAVQGPVDLVMDSLGVAELPDVVNAIKKKDKKFLKSSQAKANLRLVTMGQSGALKGVSERVAYVKGYAQMVRKPGMQALYMFPIEGITAEQMRNMYPGVSQLQEGDTVIPHDNLQSNKHYLTLPEQEQLAADDQAIAAAVSLGEYPVAAQLAEERGRHLADAMQAVSDGNIQRLELPKARTKKHLQSSRVLLRALGNKQTRTLRSLKRRGFVHDTIHGELERVVPRRRTERAYPDPESAQRNTTIIEGAPHGSIVAQTEKVVNVIYDSGLRKAA